MFGTVQTETGFAFFEDKNPLFVPSPLFATTVAPFGRPQIQQIHTRDYAQLKAAVKFCEVLHGQLIRADDIAYEGAERATFTVPYPKYVILCGTKRVLAGTIAWIIGDDTVYGSTIPEKAGKVAELLGEVFNSDVHIPLMNALMAAALAAV